MSDQARLVFPPVGAPFQRHSDTSYAAACEAEKTSGVLRDLVLSFVRSRGDSGATDEEIDTHFDRANTLRPRRVELVHRGLLVDSLSRRRTLSGRLAVVWVALGDDP